MITMAAAGLGFIVVVAVVVAILDVALASAWRVTAAERRQSWEARHTADVDAE